MIATAALECAHVDLEFPIWREISLWHAVTGIPADAARVRALSDVTFDVPRGRIVGVIGSNGAGKSTLLRVLGGVYPPTRGTVAVAGPVAGLFELGGFGNAHVTGREYAVRYLRLTGVRGDLSPHLDDIREFSELGDAFERTVRTYSTGMAARLYFAAATSAQHDIYLIDEMLAVGDEHFQMKCQDRMRQRLGAGASGVLVTHDWASIIRLCEDAHILEQGKIVYTGRSDHAVVRYLDLQPPPPVVARFAADNPTRFAVRSGDDVALSFAVEILQPAPVELSASIETLRRGYGWEILMLSPRMAVGSNAGRYDVLLRVPRLPLPGGSYLLNLFLRRQATAPDGAGVLDVRTWTAGNAWRLDVAGEPSTTMVSLPFRARPWPSRQP